MDGDIEVTLTLEIDKSCSTESISSILEQNHYRFSATAKRVPYSNPKGDVTQNNMIQCKKRVTEGDIGHVHIIGDDLVEMQISVRRIIHRSYNFLPKPEEQPEHLVLLTAFQLLFF